MSNSAKLVFHPSPNVYLEEESYRIPANAVRPILTIMPPAGNYAGNILVSITASAPSIIYYSVGSPTTFSEYAGPFTLSPIQVVTVYYFAVFSLTPFLRTPTFSALYNIIDQLFVSATPHGGPPTEYDYYVDVSFIPTKPATIYYTVDGSTPNVLSDSTVEAIPIRVNSGLSPDNLVHLKFFAVSLDTYHTVSPMVEEIYTIYGDPAITSIDFITVDTGQTLPIIHVNFDQSMDPACIGGPNLDLTFLDATEATPTPFVSYMTTANWTPLAGGWYAAGSYWQTVGPLLQLYAVLSSPVQLLTNPTRIAIVHNCATAIRVRITDPFGVTQYKQIDSCVSGAEYIMPAVPAIGRIYFEDVMNGTSFDVTNILIV